MIYVPQYENFSCVYLYDKDTIRVLNPYDNTYTDYFINSHYVSKTGVNHDNLDIECINQNNLTTDFYYRNDLDSILVIFFIILIVCFYFPYRLFSRAFGRWFKL